MKHRLLHPARQEFDEAIAFYESRQQGLGIRFLDAVGLGIDRILERPTTWPIISENARIYRLRRFPYGIIYDIEVDEIIIVAVADLRRRSGYWKGRR